MTLNTFTAGVNTSFSSELNENFLSYSVVEVYTSTGFDFTITGNSQTATSSYEMTAVASSSLYGADYIIIEVSCASSTDTSGGSSDDDADINLKYEVKETGGSYSTVFDETINSVRYAGRNHLTNTNKYVHTLTAGQKSNGVQVKISGSGTTGDQGGVATLANKQAILTLSA